MPPGFSALNTALFIAARSTFRKPEVVIVEHQGHEVELAVGAASAGTGSSNGCTTATIGAAADVRGLHPAVAVGERIRRRARRPQAAAAARAAGVADGLALPSGLVGAGGGVAGRGRLWP